MKVYVDTNVLIDFVCRREPFAQSAKIFFAKAYMGHYDLQTSALSFVTTMYVAHKYNHDEVRGLLLKISNFVEVLDLKHEAVIDMLASDWKDYEDATQNYSALLAQADCIVTRNPKDFKNSTLQVLTVDDFLQKLFS